MGTRRPCVHNHHQNKHCKLHTHAGMYDTVHSHCLQAYYLVKSEPQEFSIDDLEAKPQQTEPWTGVCVGGGVCRQQMAWSKQKNTDTSKTADACKFTSSQVHAAAWS